MVVTELMEEEVQESESRPVWPATARVVSVERLGSPERRVVPYTSVRNRLPGCELLGLGSLHTDIDLPPSGMPGPLRSSPLLA